MTYTNSANNKDILPLDIENQTSLCATDPDKDIFTMLDIPDPADSTPETTDAGKLLQDEFRKLDGYDRELDTSLKIMQKAVEDAKMSGNFIEKGKVKRRYRKRNFSKMDLSTGALMDLYTVGLKLASISYLRMTKDYCNAFDDDNKEIFSLSINTKHILRYFGKRNGLHRTARNYIVNLKKVSYIEKVDRKYILHFIGGNHSIPVGEKYLLELKPFMRKV